MALHEALVPFAPERRSLVGQLNGLTSLPAADGPPDAHLGPATANAALAEVLRGLTRDRTRQHGHLIVPARIDALERELAAGLAAAPDGRVAGRARRHGRRLAAGILDWAAQDRGRAVRANQQGAPTPPPLPGRWEPTPPAYAPPLLPSWGRNRPFVLPSTALLDPGPPPAYPVAAGSALATEAYEVYETVQSLTEDQEVTARFWSDESGITATPPGHWSSITNQVIDASGASLDVAADAHARLGVALADAFVCCWDTKYRYNLARPITYIREAIDPRWGEDGPLMAPPFPGYTSAHSTHSAAAAAVLTQVFGDIGLVDATHEARGWPPRTYGSFAQAAAESAISRLYGGLHYRSAVQRGRDQGERIGARAGALALH